jgi:hypothetical protein
MSIHGAPPAVEGAGSSAAAAAGGEEAEASHEDVEHSPTRPLEEIEGDLEEVERAVEGLQARQQQLRKETKGRREGTGAGGWWTASSLLSVLSLGVLEPSEAASVDDVQMDVEDEVGIGHGAEGKRRSRRRRGKGEAKSVAEWVQTERTTEGETARGERGTESDSEWSDSGDSSTVWIVAGAG